MIQKKRESLYFKDSHILMNETSGARTPDNLIKSQEAMPLFSEITGVFVDTL